MGVRGLTTFINNRAHLYLEAYELLDTEVVLDGNSIASNLYKWHCKSNDCFGGDYDKYAHVVRNFFSMLSQCNITPYIILDGGYEKRKLKTVIDRMQNKIRTAEALNPTTEGSQSVFPLFLRDVFVDIVLELGLKCARCEYEGDMTIAGIAKVLECPVISYDSDFYIFGCLYIPFSTVDLAIRKGKGKSSYLSCQIYRIENFLQAYGGLDRGNLPLLAVLLGNDYVKGRLFTPFFRNLKIQKCGSNQSDQQKKIKSVIIWLQNENVESAIKTILGRFKGFRRDAVLRKIEDAMKGYFDINHDLLNYLQIKPKSPSSRQELDFSTLNSDADVCSDSEECSESEESFEDDLEVEENCTLSEILKTNYRKCQYPACFMDMITLTKYYCTPQVEDGSSEHSHTISLNILNKIYNILTPDATKGLTIVCRTGKSGITHKTLPRLEENVPVLADIEEMSLEDRQTRFLSLLEIDNKFTDILKSFPEEWHLFLISLQYALKNGLFDDSIIYSCIMCFIILHYIDPKIGFFRVPKSFDKKFADSLVQIKAKNLRHNFTTFESLPLDDCIVFMEKTITYFQTDLKLKSNYRLYDKVLVHSLSQMQSIFLHVKYLNSVFNNPYPVLIIHNIFNGTFLYNMTMNLRKRANRGEYIDLILKDCTSVLGAINHVFVQLYVPSNSSNDSARCGKKRRKRKKKKTSVDAEDSENLDVEEEIEALIDPDNPYSILAVL